MPYTVHARKGSNNFRIRGTHFGIRLDRSSGTSIREEAEAVARAWEREVYEQQILGKRPGKPFSSAVVDYVNHGGETKHLTPLVSHFKDRDVRHLRQEDLDAAAKKIGKGKAPSTVNRQIHTPFIAIMTLAAANDYCEHRRWRRPKQPEGRTDYRTPEEVDAVLAQLPPTAAMVTTLTVGVFSRITETLNLRRRDISGDLVTFWGDETKGGYTRTAPLPPRAMSAAVALLERPGKPDDPLFVSDRWNDVYADYRSINHTLVRACKRADVEPFRVHVLRHTGATWRYAMTKDLQHIMATGGWKSLGQVQRYVHGASDQLAGAAIAAGWGV